MAFALIDRLSAVSGEHGEKFADTWHWAVDSISNHRDTRTDRPEQSEQSEWVFITLAGAGILAGWVMTNHSFKKRGGWQE